MEEIKKYQVIIEDEWHNLYHLGFYDELEESISDVNCFLNAYNLSISKLKEYASTFGMCFDTTLETEDGTCVFIRGFIFK